MRLLLSGWTGRLLLVVMLCGVGYGLHSNRAPTPTEQVLAFASLALCGGWVFVAWRYRR